MDVRINQRSDTKFDDNGIPQYNNASPVACSPRHTFYIRCHGDYGYDPLGITYLSLKETVNGSIPVEIVQEIISFLCYTESTMHGPAGGGGTSNPTTRYGTEALVLLTPPAQTFLTSNCYCLHEIRYRLGWGGITHACEIFVGIQIFDTEKLSVPGKGTVVFKDELQISKGDQEFVIQPNIDLKCGQMYMFWITCVEGEFQAGLIDGGNENAIQLRNALKLTFSDLNYYATSHSKHQYLIRQDFMNYYQITFTAKQ